jgi:hypothetical protein
MMPPTISAIPASMPGSMGMPARENPCARAIQNIGRWSITPMLTIKDPSQKSSALRRSEN